MYVKIYDGRPEERKVSKSCRSYYVKYGKRMGNSVTGTLLISYLNYNEEDAPFMIRILHSRDSVKRVHVLKNGNDFYLYARSQRATFLFKLYKRPNSNRYVLRSEEEIKVLDEDNEFEEIKNYADEYIDIRRICYRQFKSARIPLEDTIPGLTNYS